LSAGAPPQTPSWILWGLLLRGRGRDERGREGRIGEGREGRGEEGKKEGEGRERKDGDGGGRVGPQAKSWPLELFSWRRRCQHK